MRNEKKKKQAMKALISRDLVDRKTKKVEKMKCVLIVQRELSVF